jgi:hypothetical protein
VSGGGVGFGTKNKITQLGRFKGKGAASSNAIAGNQDYTVVPQLTGKEDFFVCNKNACKIASNRMTALAGLQNKLS